MSYLLFLLLGLGSGAIYAMLALGLVLKFRSAGVIDIAARAAPAEAEAAVAVLLSLDPAGRFADRRKARRVPDGAQREAQGLTYKIIGRASAGRAARDLCRRTSDTGQSSCDR